MNEFNNVRSHFRMKLFNWHYSLIFFGLILLWGSGGQTFAAEESKWSFIGFTKYRDALFIDKTSLSSPSAGKVFVTARIEPSAKSLFRSNIKREIPQYRKTLKNFKYLILEMEVVCPENRMRFRKVEFYDANGKVMRSSADPKSPWKSVAPGSLWKDLARAVCP